MICPSCREELPAVCLECGNPRDPQWIACVKEVPGLLTQHAHICFECGSKLLDIDLNDDTAQLAERISNAMTTTNETTSIPGLDVRTGVDAEWINDSRAALGAMLRDPDGLARVLLEEPRMGETPVTKVARISCELADAMRAERGKRGGVRNPNDPREMMSLMQEHMPMILKFIENIGAMGEKRRG